MFFWHDWGILWLGLFPWTCGQCRPGTSVGPPGRTGPDAQRKVVFLNGKFGENIRSETKNIKNSLQISGSRKNIQERQLFMQLINVMSFARCFSEQSWLIIVLCKLLGKVSDAFIKKFGYETLDIKVLSHGHALISNRSNCRLHWSNMADVSTLNEETKSNLQSTFLDRSFGFIVRPCYFSVFWRSNVNSQRRSVGFCHNTARFNFWLTMPLSVRSSCHACALSIKGLRLDNKNLQKWWTP